MGVMVDQNGNPVSGTNDKQNSNFIGTLTYPNDGTNKNKTTWTSADGGIPFPEEKYYDKYTYREDDEHYNRRILGDATGQMGPFARATYGKEIRQIGSWYADEGSFISHFTPWFRRGGERNMGLGSGVFSFGARFGSAESIEGYRIVLAFH